MWPFNKKVPTDTLCQSGVLFHDDEHHSWGQWKIVSGTSYSIFRKEGTPMTGQMRTCVVCGYGEVESL
uniref:Uncharacterized protein n=1 Tax=viral metagenome TaxID=1070528 RepID=A0A6M3JJI8_9ZZZZ